MPAWALLHEPAQVMGLADQAHREALAAPLALEAACQAVDLIVRVGLLRNDAEAAIAALTKGSIGSAPMQCKAVRLNRIAYNSELDLILSHVPDLALVEEGIIDEASRNGTHYGPDANLAHVLGPRISDSLWASITALLDPLHWRVKVNLFASEANARAARYFSRFGEPGAEVIDAFTVLDWAASQCPLLCIAAHQYAYSVPGSHKYAQFA
jgi:hypothetical protein